MPVDIRNRKFVRENIDRYFCACYHLFRGYNCFSGISEDNDITEIARFYGFSVLMDNSFEGRPNILIDYVDDNIKGHYDLISGEFTDGDFSKCMIRIISEWLDDHIQLLKAMWDEKTLTMIPDWE